ncbi:GNAT family N-acetyltransferase [Curtobacterium sp. ISL-83]|uniref:GNAT family N-acetyltransferase n=1 Tax=Curtobacterium sp. ISL-83 TaxID=2819145 RepID=UPI001BEC2AF5|nr:GNAT family N-acetyltransferase [Curtobacterium sp. ISL-83]MBT2502198.1 GNAT family N-acetyltransferase [Curtobacterium sp. ISL-83]
MTTSSDVRAAAVRRVPTAEPAEERWIAAGTSTETPSGGVVISAPGAHLGNATRPGEVELRLQGGSADATTGRDLRTLVDHVVDRARSRFAVAVVADTTGWSDGARRVLADAGFRGGDVRGAALRVLDLSLAEDGTPTRVLDAPALASLNGAHARFAERRGEVARYLPDVSVWTGVPQPATASDWADVRTLLGPGAGIGVSAATVLPDGWHPIDGASGVQLTGEAVQGAPDAEAVDLTADDVPEMTALVERTKPGPFLPRTIELGRYLGIRRDGRLVAMAGERLHPPGWTEISAVCTDEAYRGQGLGRRLVLAVAHGIRERGETPLMHAAAGNPGAIGLYRHLGFQLRDRGALRFVQVP